jgi:hypothetical protein
MLHQGAFTTPRFAGHPKDVSTAGVTQPSQETALILAPLFKYPIETSLVGRRDTVEPVVLLCKMQVGEDFPTKMRFVLC